MKVEITFRCSHTIDRLAIDQVDADRMQFVAGCHDCQDCFMARVNEMRGMSIPEVEEAEACLV